MRVDFSSELLNYNGAPIVADANGGKSMSATLGWVCCAALVATVQGQQLAPEQHLKQFTLAQRIHAVLMDGSGQLELSVEDVAHLRQLVAKVWGVSVAGAALLLLDEQAK